MLAAHHGTSAERIEYRWLMPFATNSLMFLELGQLTPLHLKTTRAIAGTKAPENSIAAPTQLIPTIDPKPINTGRCCGEAIHIGIDHRLGGTVNPGAGSIGIGVAQGIADAHAIFSHG
jgi:hypothetical protein